MRTLLLLATLTWASAADTVIPGPWALRAGLATGASELRDATGTKGLYLGGGLILPRRGVVGKLGADVDWRGSWDKSDRFDALSACYIERVPIAEGAYAGAGAGLALIRLKQPEWVRTTARPLLKVVVGAVLPWKPPVPRSRLAMEGALFATQDVGDLHTYGVAVAASFGF